MSKSYNHENSCWIIASHNSYFMRQSIKYKPECVFVPMVADLVVKSTGSHVHGSLRIKKKTHIWEPRHILSSFCAPPTSSPHWHCSHLIPHIIFSPSMSLTSTHPFPHLLIFSLLICSAELSNMSSPLLGCKILNLSLILNPFFVHAVHSASLHFL